MDFIRQKPWAVSAWGFLYAGTVHNERVFDGLVGDSARKTI